MAKLLKHLGFGSKKNPPHPPQRDYVGKQNAEIDGAFEDEDFQGGVVINDDGAEKSSPDQVGGQRLGSPPTRADGRIQVLPLPERTTSARSPSSTVGGSQAGSRINQLLTDERQTNPGAASGGMEPDDIADLLDDYSEPTDKVNPPTDDYSEPYETNKLFKGRVAVPEDGRKPPHLYDDPYEPGSSQSSANASEVTTPSSLHAQGAGLPVNVRLSTAEMDTRPLDDYDSPWEWSAKNRLLQQLHGGGVGGVEGESSVPELGSQISPTPTSVSSAHNQPSHHSSADQKTPAGQKSTTDGLPNPAPKVRPKITPRKTVSRQKSSEKLSSKPTKTSDKKSERRVSSSGQDHGDDPKLQLEESREEGDKSVDEAHRLSEWGLDRLRPPDGDQADGGRELVRKSSRDNYDDPWDTPERQQKLETKLKAAKHRRDGKAPPEPLMLDGEHISVCDQLSMNFMRRKKESSVGEDSRPMDDYDTPWDTKSKSKLLSQLYTREGGELPPSNLDDPAEREAFPSTSRGEASEPLSPKSKQQVNLELDLGCRALNALAERVDPEVPLQRQGWYHGAIGRLDAEKLLRLQREGSYLVRQSESNKNDFSLSLKSARGFMHMKIVLKSNQFILGQFSQPFSSIPLMIAHYSLSKLPIKGAEHMTLLHPVHNELL